MSTINTKRESSLRDEKRREESHLNWMGGASFDISDPLVKLRIASASCFFGEPMYYHGDGKNTDRRPVRAAYPSPFSSPRSGLSLEEISYLREVLGAVDPQEWRMLTPAQMMERTIDEALSHDPEATLQWAQELRQNWLIRTTPQVILVRAANHPNVRGSGWGGANKKYWSKNLITRYALDIILRGDEPAVCLAYQLATFGKPVPNALKRALAHALEGMDAYQLAKYRMESRAVSTVDVVNMVHPYHTEAIGSLVKGTLKLDENTWESIISKKGSTKEAWEEAVKVMGHMALLRNLRNFHEKGADPEKFLPKLIEGAKTGKQLPFRYLSAYKAVEGTSGRILDAVEECLEISLGNMPHFSGRVMALCDNSGSAQRQTLSSMSQMSVARVGNLSAVITGRCSDDGYIGVFGDRLEVRPVQRRESVLSQARRAFELGQHKSIGHHTENGIWLFWDKAIKTKEHWDHVFIYSDMQAGHGGLYGTDPSAYEAFRWWHSRNIDIAKLIDAYRRQVNPNVFVYLVQIAGYQDTIVPEYYDRTFILGGWGSGIFQFAAEMSQMFEKPGQ